MCEDLQDILARDKERSGPKSLLIRDDYKECVKNPLLVLNGNLETEKPAKMRKRGAAHVARWVSQVLHCQNLY